MAEELGFDLQALRLRGVVRAVLASFWMLEDHGHDWDWCFPIAEILWEERRS